MEVVVPSSPSSSSTSASASSLRKRPRRSWSWSWAMSHHGPQSDLGASTSSSSSATTTTLTTAAISEKESSAPTSASTRIRIQCTDDNDGESSFFDPNRNGGSEGGGGDSDGPCHGTRNSRSIIDQVHNHSDNYHGKNDHHDRDRYRCCHRRRCNRNRPSSSVLSRTNVGMTIFAVVLMCSYYYPALTMAQFTNFEPSTTSCPSDGAITGYTSIESINDDIETEKIRIEGGGTPQESYLITLCPDTTFDTSTAPLQPTLDQITVTCGDNGGGGDVGNNCILSGGPTNILIEDSQIDGYTIDRLNFVGLTFTGFTDWSIDVTASSSSAAEGAAQFTDCLWQDFITTTGGIARMNNEDGNGDAPMSLVVDTSRIQSSSGTSSDASLAMGFENTGGSIEVNNVVVQNIQVVTTLFQTTAGGTTAISSSSITNSVLPAMSNVNVGTSTFSNVTISDNTEIVRMFAASGAGSFVNILQSSAIERNTGANLFQIVRITDDAVGVVRNVAIRSNNPVEYGVYVLVESDGTTPTATIEDTVFEGNTQEDWSLVMSEGSGASVAMARNDFIDNSGGLMNIGAFFGGNVRFTQTCFIRNTHFLVALILEFSTFEASENYVEDEVSQICSGMNEDEGPGRLSVEQPGSMCFRGGEECLVDCLPNANDSPVCLSQVAPPTIAPTPAVTTTSPTNSPTDPVTGAPEPTDPPTDPVPTELPASTPSPTDPPIPPQSPTPTDPPNPPSPTWGPLIPVPPGPTRPPPTRAPSMSSRVPTRPPSRPSRAPTRPPSRHTRHPTRPPLGPPHHPPTHGSSKSEKSSKKDKSSNKSKGKNSKKSKSQKSTVRPNDQYGIGYREEFYGIGNARPVISPTPSNRGSNADDDNNDEDRNNNMSNQANNNFFFGIGLGRLGKNKKKIEKVHPAIVLRGIGTGE